MAQHLNNITSDHARYTSPVPVIGLYTAVATLACFLSMLYDTAIGFHHKKPWLPCKLFPLNSFTLSLLSIATKLPVDLTTSMPRAQDQFSKLSSTTLICICMGFFMPSLGIKSDSECFWNMAALTLLVATVVVDVAVQIGTKVIFSFQVEHVIILSCMLILLAVMWSSILDINLGKELIMDRNREILEKGLSDKKEGSVTLIQRLKWCYVYSYSSNPQVVLCQIPHCATIGMLCSVCSIVLLESLVKTLVHKEFKFKFDEGVNSDYRWSILIVVLAQILAVLVGSFTVCYRWIMLVNKMNLGRFQHWNKVFRVLPYWSYELLFGKLFALPFKFSKVRFMDVFQVMENLVGTVLYGIQTGVVWTNELVVSTCLGLRKIFGFLILIITGNCYGRKKSVLGLTKEEVEYQDVVYPAEPGLKKWMLKIGFEHMERWTKVHKADLRNLNECLCQNNVPSNSESIMEQIEKLGLNHSARSSCKYNVSCLSMVVLVRTISVVLTSDIYEGRLSTEFVVPLVQVLDEAFEIIFFVDWKLNAENVSNKAKSTLAKDVWMCRDIRNHWFQKKFIGPSMKDYFKNCGLAEDDFSESSKINHVFGIISKLMVSSFGFVNLELKTLCDFIDVNRKDYETIQDLCLHMNQVFVAMLRYFLARLPQAIYKDIAESPIEECEDRVGLALKFLCKLELLERNVKWDFPEETKLTSLITVAPIPDNAKDNSHGTQNRSSACSSGGHITNDADVLGEIRQVGTRDSL